MRAVQIVDTLIHQRRELVFDILSDFRHYDVWLPQASVLKGSSSISEGPISEGTTYVESSRWGTRAGTFTKLDRPARISYRQPTTLRPAWLGVIDVQVDDCLAEAEDGASTLLTRTLILDFHGPVGLFGNAVANSFRAEIERMYASLKAYAETSRDTGDN